MRAAGVAILRVYDPDCSMIELVPMSEPEFLAYVAEIVPKYAREKVLAGHWSEAESLASSEKEFRELLPEGLNTSDNFLCKVRDGATSSDVGILWYKIMIRAGRKAAYIMDIEIHPAHRRMGYGERAIAALQATVLERGATGIGLNVFGHNPGARALYEKVGFTVSNTTMFKSLA